MPSQSRTTYDRALTLLGFRARSAEELRRRLRRDGAPPDEVDAAIDRLIEQKVLDDRDFAVQFARNRLLGAGASRRRVMQELARKGVARAVANEALSRLLEDERLDPTAAIGRVAEKKWAALRRLDDTTRRRRLYAFLARRGFDPDEIRSAMSSLGADPDA